jgi:hypothetical protein
LLFQVKACRIHHEMKLIFSYHSRGGGLRVQGLLVDASDLLSGLFIYIEQFEF